MNYFLNCHSEESIRTRYKMLAMQLHPDRNPEDLHAKEKFQDMLEQRDRAFKAAYAKSGKSTAEIDELLQEFVLDLDKLSFKSLHKVAAKFAEGLPENASFGHTFFHVLDKLLQAEKTKNKPLEGRNKKSLE